MAELFTLTVTDNSETIDFIGTTFKVKDGGFDIGMPKSTKQLTEVRPGFYRLSYSKKEYRTATIQFAIHGATRTAVLTSLATLERLINSIEGQEWISDSTRGQLKYAFDGAVTATYFEVYACDLKMPQDMLSIRVAHAVDGSGFYIQDLELKLYLSPVGYGLSIYSDVTSGFEIPLYNPSVGAKQTGGVIVKNPGYLTANGDAVNNYPYVEIAAADVPGAQPYVTKLQLIPQATGYSYFYEIYIGKKLSPFPSAADIILDDGDIIDTMMGGTTETDGTPVGGTYRQLTISGAPSGNFGDFADYAWEYRQSLTGMFLPFHVSANTINACYPFYLAFGIDDYVTYGIRTQTEVVAYECPPGGQSHFRMPPIQLPPTNTTLNEYGTLHEDLWLGVWYAFGTNATFNLDYIYLLPIDNGVRVWVNRESPGSGVQMVDNVWKGISYNYDSGSGKVWSGFGATMNPIFLSPGKTQRLYFTSRGAGSVETELARQFQVRLWGVPAFETLAY